MEIEMKIKGLVTDPVSKMPIVVLEDLQGGRVLPIWIGVFEANAIALTIENISTPRPMTHDLIRNLLKKFEIQIDRIIVTDVRNNTFYAEIFCRAGEHSLSIDARPSDAIALALRMGAPIYVDDRVVRQTHGLKVDASLEGSENLRKWLDTLRPEDLGKYKM